MTGITVKWNGQWKKGFITHSLPRQPIISLHCLWLSSFTHSSTTWDYVRGKLMFRLSHFLVFGHFWQWSYENTKILAIFVYILQVKMGKIIKNGKKITHLKWPKYQKPKDENMGWDQTKWLENLSSNCRDINFKSEFIESLDSY